MHPKMRMTPAPHLSKRTVEEYHAPVKPAQQIASIIVIKYNNLELTLEGVSTGDGSDLNTIAELIAASLKMESSVDFELFVLENELLIPMRDQLKEIYSITRQPTKENEMTQATTNPAQTAEATELANLRAALAAKEAEVASLKAAASAAAATAAPAPAPAAAPAAEPTAAATATDAAPAAAPAAVPAAAAPAVTTNDGWSTTTKVVVGVTATGVIAGAGYALWRKLRT